MLLFSRKQYAERRGRIFYPGDFRGCLRFGDFSKRKEKPDGSIFFGYCWFFSEKYDISLFGDAEEFSFYSRLVVLTLVGRGAVAGGDLGSCCPKEAYLIRRVLKK